MQMLRIDPTPYKIVSFPFAVTHKLCDGGIAANV